MEEVEIRVLCFNLTNDHGHGHVPFNFILWRHLTPPPSHSPPCSRYLFYYNFPLKGLSHKNPGGPLRPRAPQLGQKSPKDPSQQPLQVDSLSNKCWYVGCKQHNVTKRKQWTELLGFGLISSFFAFVFLFELSSSICHLSFIFCLLFFDCFSYWSHPLYQIFGSPLSFFRTFLDISILFLGTFLNFSMLFIHT